MRVRITRWQRGDVDGINLAAFQVGLIYDVAPSLGTYLLTVGSAELVGLDEPSLIVPLPAPGNAVASSKDRPAADDSGRRCNRLSPLFGAPIKKPDR